MAFFKTLFKNNSFVRGFLSLSVGHVISFFLAFFAVPLITRLYTPDEYGLFGAFLSWVLILSTFSTLKLDVAVVVADEEDVLPLSWVVVSFALVYSASVFVGVLILRNLLPTRIYFWLPVAVFLTALFSLATYLLTRMGNFLSLGFLKIVSSAVKFGLQIALNPLKQLGLVLGYLASLVVYLPNLIISLKKFTPAVHENKIDKRNALSISKAVLKKYSKYPLFVAPSNLINALSRHFPVVLVMWLYGDSLTGLFSLTLRFLGVPLFMFGDALAKTFLNKAGSTREPALLAEFTKKFIVWVSIFSGPVFAVLMVYSKWFFSWFVGKNWLDAWHIVFILAPWYFFRFISSPLSSNFLVKKKQEFLLIADSFFFVFGMGALVVGKLLFKSYIWSFILYSAVGSLVSLTITFLVLKLTVEKRFLGVMLFMIASFLLSIAVSFGVRFYFEKVFVASLGTFWWGLICAVASAALSIVLLYLIKTVLWGDSL